MLLFYDEGDDEANCMGLGSASEDSVRQGVGLCQVVSPLGGAVV